MKDREKEIKYLMYIKSEMIRQEKKQLKQLKQELIQIQNSKQKRRGKK